MFDTLLTRVLIVAAGLLVLGALLEVLRGRAAGRHEHGSDKLPRRRPSSYLRLIVFAIIVWVAVSGFFAYQRSQQEQNNREEAARRAKAQQTEQSISQFAETYNAVTDWRNALRNKTATDSIYSAEVTPLFVRTDRRPLLFVVSLRDVTTEGDHYMIQFEGRINFRSKFRLLLDSSADEANLLMSQPSDSLNRYAVVAQIWSVDSAEGETGGKSISLARGRCVDVMALGRYIGDVSDILSTFRSLN